MPIVVPPYVQYQAPLFPLRGLWNHAPEEGDRMVAAEINWGVTTGAGEAVQFQLSGNSPVAFSQIVAAQVDNTSNATDVQFQFPDSGYTLVVPAYAQITTPVFTNALQFYVFSPGAVVGDRTVFQVFNSMPPPIPVQLTNAQVSVSAQGVPLATNATTQLIPAGVNGTLKAMTIDVAAAGGASASGASLVLQDGTGRTVWGTGLQLTASTDTNVAYPLSGLSVPFVNGLNFIVGSSTVSGFASINLYYIVP